MSRQPIVPESRTCPVCSTSFDVGGRGRPPRTQVYCSTHCQMLARPPIANPGSHAPRPRKNLDTLHNENWLRVRYLDERMTAAEIGLLIGCSSPSVRWALDKFEIPVRSMAEAKRGRLSKSVWTPEAREALAAKRRGSANPAWKGGTTPYSRTRETQRLHGSPDATCEACGTRPVVIHHENENPLDNRPENIRYLCQPCHIKHHKPHLKSPSGSSP